ncbi:phosphate acetyltransferase [Virgibacillus alimentarius]|uniref:Phosphate acetyltransferase n=1 Tax=Virgibacillus alimentarius TaxID=698769 RepID=A0ABS4S900_9BACI|nr:phosphate acetyltransferase [Virgibacillus alimentarius]MBP2257976.1 phosphate acetyltransferase [Virgibacillus alimentarius]
MSNLFDDIKAKIQQTDKRIVFPEGLDARILQAASKLSKMGMVTPILLGDQVKVMKQAETMGVNIDACQLIDPSRYEQFDAMVEAFVQRRKGKVSKVDAEKQLCDENYFGTMLVYMNQADGLVSGAAHSTADTVRPALQIMKTKEGINKTSGVFIMVRGEEKYVFADCAINIAPTSEDLAEIAMESAETAKLFDIDPRIAMLSFSTKGSAQSEETEKVEQAVKLAKERNASLVIDGEIQFDAAFVPSVAAKKAPDAMLKGNANVFIFPSLEAGNIGYKIAERLGEFEAVGPVLQGLTKPVNDLSRGCSAEDVFKLALITAAQAK